MCDSSLYVLANFREVSTQIAGVEWGECAGKAYTSSLLPDELIWRAEENPNKLLSESHTKTSNPMSPTVYTISINAYSIIKYFPIIQSWKKCDISEVSKDFYKFAGNTNLCNCAMVAQCLCVHCFPLPFAFYSWSHSYAIRGIISSGILLFLFLDCFSELYHKGGDIMAFEGLPNQ